MRHYASAILAAAMVWASAAQAATDPGPMLHDTQTGGHRVGAGVQATVSIPLGRAASDARTTRLSLRAGPSVTSTGSNTGFQVRTQIAPLTELAVRSGHSTVWSLAGRPVAASYSAQALRDQRDGMPGGERNAISTLGAVAIGVGVAVIVGAVVLYERISDTDRCCE